MSRRIDKDEAAHLQYETEHTEPPKSRSVIVYMVILVAAAFLLLLLAYFMQLRTADTVEGLHQSVNSFQTIDQLVEDNRLLQEEVDRLKTENAELSDKLAQREETLRNTEEALSAAISDSRDSERRADALATLHQLRVLYNGKQYKDAMALLKKHPDMEADLTLVNSEMSDEELKIYDPLAAYQRIAKLLGVE